jgi:hypothetical protein
MTDWHRKLAFQQLVLAKSLSVGQAAERYGCTTRTVRYWCRNAPISCKIAGGTQRISDPLLSVYAAGGDQELWDFVFHGRVSEIVLVAFDQHGVPEALADYVAKSGNPRNPAAHSLLP